MKSKLLTFLLGALLLAPAVHAEDASRDERRYAKFMAAKPATPEQLEKIQFAAEIPTNVSPFSVAFQIQNGLTEQVLVGMILTVTYHDPATNTEKVVELYQDCRDLVPLSSMSGQIPLFKGAEVVKLSPKIALKEVRIRQIQTIK